MIGVALSIFINGHLAMPPVAFSTAESCHTAGTVAGALAQGDRFRIICTDIQSGQVISDRSGANV